LAEPERWSLEQKASSRAECKKRVGSVLSDGDYTIVVGRNAFALVERGDEE
jgi:hypothetical protein